MLIIHTIFAVIKGCLAAAVAALAAGVTIVIIIVLLAVLIGFGIASLFGIGGSRFAARRRARRETDSGK